MSVLFLSIGIGFAMSLTKRRTSLPALVTVITLGCLALVIYVLGMPMPIVFGVCQSSVLLVFPVALVSPKNETVQKMIKQPKGPSIQCPVCSTKVTVESDVRPLRMECPNCENMLRIEGMIPSLSSESATLVAAIGAASFFQKVVADEICPAKSVCHLAPSHSANLSLPSLQ